MTNASKTSSGSTFFPSGTYKLLRPGCPKAAGTAGEEEEDGAGHHLHLLCRLGWFGLGHSIPLPPQHSWTESQEPRDIFFVVNQCKSYQCKRIHLGMKHLPRAASERGLNIRVPDPQAVILSYFIWPIPS